MEALLVPALEEDVEEVGRLSGLEFIILEWAGEFMGLPKRHRFCTRATVPMK